MVLSFDTLLILSGSLSCKGCLRLPIELFFDNLAEFSDYLEYDL